MAAVLCPDCRRLVGAEEEVCPFCGAARPGARAGATVFRLLLGGGLHRLVIVVCAVLYVASLALDPAAVRVSGLTRLLAPSAQSLFVLGGAGALPIFGYERWWTILSAGWLHGSLLHILFNMLWVRQLAPAVEALYGSARATVLFIFAGASGFAVSSLAGAFLGFLPPMLQGATLTIGASAAIFGLLGGLVRYGRSSGAAALGQEAWTWAVVLFVFGFLMPGIDNWGHLGGFVGGYLAGTALEPSRPERRHHRTGALIGLAASAGAIVWSIVDAVSR